MSNVWVYKFDGTTQCDTDIKETSLDDMLKQLATLIGSNNVTSMKKCSRPMVQLCGMPTGAANCYEITEEGWGILSTGISGNGGFQRVDHGPLEKEGEVNLGRVIGSLTSSNPQQIQDLIGHPLRVYESGEALTLDWRPSRCNIEIDGEKMIIKVWFG